ncbi:MAG: hypothetical protein KTR35_17325 [Gammaproteobacteria bacterium]|nr:hypothetical protein [Gammaproteobacteria bacterium]
MEVFEAQQGRAEQYLDEMLEAERNSDYVAFCKRFEEDDLIDFDEQAFKEAVEAQRQELGGYQSRIFLGALNGYQDVTDAEKHPDCLRYVWRGLFEKNETLIVVGIHERNGIWHVNENMFFY